MKRLLLGIALITISLNAICAQTISKKMELGKFNSIDASFAYTINVQKGISNSIEVIYPERFEEYLDISVSGNTLHLGTHSANQSKNLFNKLFRQNDISLSNDEKIIVNVKMEEIKEIDLSGASTLYVSGKFRTDHFKLTMSGASEIEGFLNIDADKFTYSLSGASEAAVAGVFNSIDGHISGASEFELNADATTFFSGCSGASELDFRGNISEKTEVECSGASEVELSGKTFLIAIYCTGASEVDAEQMLSTDATATASGASYIKVHANNSFSLRSSGGSKIRYYGDGQYDPGHDDSSAISRGR
ncbi:MAG: DUF2807 domain-containing protein [Bacteroidales bacterium]|nr:DUF2807 domain-containing protein [Bacteroidales bacterium]